MRRRKARFNRAAGPAGVVAGRESDRNRRRPRRSAAVDAGRAQVDPSVALVDPNRVTRAACFREEVHKK
jgi:hypothetical protein